MATEFPRVNLWLDDVRPAPDGWIHAKNVQEAKDIFFRSIVVKCSLDHDLESSVLCTGYDLVCWMEENGIWPEEKPTVHSANPVGRKRMQDVIERYYAKDCQ